MKNYTGIIIVAVLSVTTFIYTILVYLPGAYPNREVVNAEVLAVVDTVQNENAGININPVQVELGLEQGITKAFDFELINRDLPTLWQNKNTYFKYTYLGSYGENTISEMEESLHGEYKWQRQLDSEGNIILGGPIFEKDGIYQLHVHNGLSFGQKQFLLGDLLHWLYSQKELAGTQLRIGDLLVQNEWVKELEILKDNSVPADVELIISTCLERNGDRRLISGWSVVKE